MTSQKPKLLILSSNPSFLNGLRDFFTEKFQIETANSIQMAEFLFGEWEPEICLLEDSENHLAWVPMVRSQKQYSKIGMIAISARASKNEEKSLRVGCDHWTQASEGLEKTLWRIQAVLRQVSSDSYRTPASIHDINQKHEDSLVQIDHLKIYTKDFLIKRMGQVVAISPTQFKLLNAFISHPDQLLSRDWIKSTVWTDSDISLRSIDAHISKLRKVLPELDPYLMNIYGKGYIFSKSRQEAA